MTFTEAIEVLITAADARRLQWEGVGEGKNPDDLVDELWESLSTGVLEAQAIEADITEAIRVVRKIYS